MLKRAKIYAGRYLVEDVSAGDDRSGGEEKSKGGSP